VADSDRGRSSVACSSERAKPARVRLAAYRRSPGVTGSRSGSLPSRLARMGEGLNPRQSAAWLRRVIYNLAVNRWRRLSTRRDHERLVAHEAVSQEADVGQLDVMRHFGPCR